VFQRTLIFLPLPAVFSAGCFAQATAGLGVVFGSMRDASGAGAQVSLRFVF
jgi:hypothetical protein